MKAIIKSSIRHGNAVFYLDSGEMMIILPGCDKKGALSVENKLREALEKYLTNEKVPKEIKLRFGSAVYPDEAKNGEELIKIAKKRLKSYGEKNINRR